MGYEDGKAGQTGRTAQKEAKRFLVSHGFSAARPSGNDIGVHLLVSPKGNAAISTKVKVNGRGQIENPRWFQLSITPSKIEAAWSSGQPLDDLWRNKITMVDFWVMVSIPLVEVWVMPSDKVMEIAELNSVKYGSRLDNQYSEPHYTKHGDIAKKQKELNLDLEVDGIPIWENYSIYRNNANPLMEYFASLERL